MVLIAVVHFLLDAEDPHQLISRIVADLAPGSYLVIAHAASDIEPDTAAAMARNYNAASSLTITPRDGGTEVRISPGGFTTTFVINTFGIVRKVRAVLADSPSLSAR